MFAVRDGFEPPRCDSVSNTFAGRLVVYPILLTYFVLINPETGGLVCQAITEIANSNTLQFNFVSI